MAPDGIDALRQERAALLSFCRQLDDDEWHTPSAAQGWRVQDVVAHMGSGCHALFSPDVMALLRSTDIEGTNDRMVDRRRDWTAGRTLDEYERWSARVLVLAGAVVRTPLAGMRVRLAELGRFPARLVLGGALVFDHHTHLRHDIAPVLSRPVPGTDANRMAVVLEWMFAVLSNQLRAARPAWLQRPLAISLDGPGGGTWRVDPDGSVTPAVVSDAVTRISGTALQFPEWGTQRVGWRDRDITITGDTDYGAQFLDAVNVV